MVRIFTVFILSLFNYTVFSQNDSLPYITILGVAQDGGYPHIGCQRACCNAAWKNDSLKKYVVALALVSPKEKKWWLFEATPDINKQLKLFSSLTNNSFNYLPEAIFITHAHIGHYTGLMQLGREAMNTKEVPVYVLPKMKNFLETNGPWSQLVSLKNIILKEIKPDSLVSLTKNISVKSLTVPHRDEFSETAGFRIFSGNKNYLFIPDIDKWEKFKQNIISEVKSVDIAFLDATFFSPEELSYRNVTEVPHPYVQETMELFKKEDLKTKNKIFFIHFNHTNPLLNNKIYTDKVLKEGFFIAEQGKKVN